MSDLSSQRNDAPNSGWSVNKTVPLAYIGAIIFQTMVFLVVGTSWVTATNQRLQVLEDFHKASLAIQARLAVLESHDRISDTQIAAITQLLNNMMQRNNSK